MRLNEPVLRVKTILLNGLKVPNPSALTLCERLNVRKIVRFAVTIKRHNAAWILFASAPTNHKSLHHPFVIPPPLEQQHGQADGRQRAP